MLQATLLVQDTEGVETYHAHSLSDDIQDILIQLEDQLIHHYETISD